MMISRRQIICGQQEPGQQKPTESHQQQTPNSNQNNSNMKTSNNKQQQLNMKSRKMAGSRASSSANKQAGQQEAELLQANQDQGSSDGYAANAYDDYVSQQQVSQWRRRQQVSAAGQQQPPQSTVGDPSGGYGRHFDPYSIYSDEEDVWYSEERLFEDHLEEIFNKWRQLDDDIWCKLIIMERNRRIGKAYARVPIVTIDGSHELSYDGYKLAINGFDNPDRDLKTEECRKRIGKGIRIKMDNFGNILIKRLSKSGVYIKEWLSSSGGGSGGGGSSQSGQQPPKMPSRQQLIKNLDGGGGLGGATPSGSSTSAASSMESPNDSAICDEVINAGGLLEQDKIYVMFDMKKFQANITQELCRPYPDKRKLEQQCFSIVGLVRDTQDVLDLPCWVMVINIVAIEMLNGRFPSSSAHHHSTMAHHNSHLMHLHPMGDPMLHHQHHLELAGSRRPSQQTPQFVSIFEQNNNNGGSGSGSGNARGKHHNSGHDKEEDPYSLPANASSSDVKSSINDYGTTSTKNMGGYEQARPYYPPSDVNGKTRGGGSSDMYGHKMMLMSRPDLKYRSKSNCNIYGPPTSGSNFGKLNATREKHNNSSSIYSPGHMLVPPPAPLGDSTVPPKLPPRDFGKRVGKSKSSSNVAAAAGGGHHQEDPNNESIYSTGLQQAAEQLDSLAAGGGGAPSKAAAAGARKTKKNRFLESLKAPLELAKSSSSRSASVMGAPVVPATPAADQEQANADKTATKGAKAKGFSKSSAKSNIKSFLGVSSSSKGNKSNKDTISDDSSNYVKVADGQQQQVGKTTGSGQEVDSVVDSQEEDHSQPLGSSSSASYNDLDIPTPDYETDENIYGLDDGGAYQDRKRGGGGKTAAAAASKGANGKKHHYKEDLYYSGFRAHVPQNIHHTAAPVSSRSVPKSLLDAGGDKMLGGGRETSRYAHHNKARELIYGSTTAAMPPAATGARYRSASMQRHYTRSQAARSQSEMYDLETENPYAMSAGLDGYSGGHRRRSASRSGYYGTGQQALGGHQTSHSQVVAGAAAFHHRVVSSMANSNYDIGRSSSGIYGNNSSSSSSDYAGWHPQMRKVNSSGYLNSIFKSHHLANQQPVDSSQPPANSHTNPLNNNGSNNNGNPVAQGYNNSKQQQYPRSYLATSRALKSSANPGARPASNLSKQQQQHQQQQAQINQVTSSIVNAGPTYRSYDSSNDSEPSYTNSSDGLDIYDHIGAHARLNHHHNQFLDLPPTNNLPQEVHVGEWENMYDR